MREGKTLPVRELRVEILDGSRNVKKFILKFTVKKTILKGLMGQVFGDGVVLSERVFLNKNKFLSNDVKN